MNTWATQGGIHDTNAATAIVLQTEAASVAKDAALLTLDGRGMIIDCNQGAETLFNYHREAMVWHAISMLLPELAELNLIENGQPNSRLRFQSRIGRQFHLHPRHGEQVACQLCLNLLDSKGLGRLSLIVIPCPHRMQAQPDYPYLSRRKPFSPDRSAPPSAVKQEMKMKSDSVHQGHNAVNEVMLEIGDFPPDPVITKADCLNSHWRGFTPEYALAEWFQTETEMDANTSS